MTASRSSFARSKKMTSAPYPYIASFLSYGASFGMMIVVFMPSKLPDSATP